MGNCFFRQRTSVGSALLALAAGVAAGVGGAPIQQAKLTAEDKVAGDYLGGAVALAGDTAVAGAVGRSTFRGTAFVFTRTGTAWSQQAALTAMDAAGFDFFGQSVAVAGDTAVVGAVGKSVNRGAAYVFTRDGTAWTQEAKLTASDAVAGDQFGISVAVAGDTAVVGAYSKNASQGAVYVFTRSGTIWTERAKLVAEDPVNGDAFGGALALEGDTVAVGAAGKTSARGAVYVFRGAAATWMQEAKLTAMDAADGDLLGLASVGLSGDTVVAGAYGSSSLLGAAYVFKRTGVAWAQEAKLTADDAMAGDRLGYSVALSGDRAVAGGYGRDSSRGAIFTFERSGIAWTQGGTLVADDAASDDRLGTDVAIEGDTVVAGAEQDDSLRGAAYAFGPAGAVPPPAGYCLPVKVKAKFNAAHPGRSSLAASGTLDTGGGVPDFSGPATFDVGGFHLDIPAFAAKGASLVYAADGIALKVTPAKNGSSHAKFTVKVIADLAGKVDPDAPLAFRFTNAAHDLGGTAALVAGVLGPHGVTAPDLGVLKASASLKGAGLDSLKLTLAFATDGALPVAAEDLTVGFGGTYSGTILAASFAPKGGAHAFAAKGPGLTKATVDYARGTITIAGAGLDLGVFPAGGNAVVVTITLGGQVLSAEIRMAGTGTKLAY